MRQLDECHLRFVYMSYIQFCLPGPFDKRHQDCGSGLWVNVRTHSSGMFRDGAQNEVILGVFPFLVDFAIFLF